MVRNEVDEILKLSFHYLLGDLVTLPAGDSGALALGDLLGLDPRHKGAEASGLGLAVLDGDLLSRLAVHLLAVHLGAPQLGLVVALLLGEGSALPLGDLVALGPGHVLALLTLHSLALPVIDLKLLHCCLRSPGGARGRGVSSPVLTRVILGLSSVIK